jgi:membrane protein implicated in regulation of membrane protease activity
MTWADFYLICFLVGLALSVLSILSGAFHLHLPGGEHLHLPGFGHGHMGHMGHIGHGHGGDISVVNFATVTAFLAWFGGVGFLLTKFSSIWLWMGFLLAVVGGVTGASLVFGFIFKVLMADEKNLPDNDWDMVGVFGRLSSAIRSDGGTGEIAFTQGGARRSAAARSEDGSAIPKDAEVYVTRYERGIAYVRRFEDLNDAKEA